jgi:hypothetical protein
MFAKSALAQSGDPPSTRPPLKTEAERQIEREIESAERWGFLGSVVPGATGFALMIASVEIDAKDPPPALLYGGLGLFGAGATWGTSCGYYQAGLPIRATMAGLGKMGLIALGVAADHRSGPSDTSLPIAVYAVVGVLAWDVVDLVQLGRIIRTDRQPTASLAPTVVVARGVQGLGLAGRF